MLTERPSELESTRGVARVEQIVVRAPLLSGEVTCGATQARFDAGDEPGFGVDLGNGQIGYVDRITTTDVFARRFGRELHERRPVSMIADPTPFAAEAYEAAAHVSVRLTRERPGALRRGFIVTHEGAYVGVARGADLMRVTAEEALATLTALRDAQRGLIEAEKLASLGALVAGVSHEINTPVGVALTAASHLQEDAATIYAAFLDGTLRRSQLEEFFGLVDEAASLITTNARRAGELVQAFKQIAVDRSSDERRRFVLADYVRDVVSSLRPRYKSRPVTIALDVEPGIEVDGYPGALSQVLTNLLVNALVHAWPDPTVAGTITIAARRDRSDVVLDFDDDGCGIPTGLQTRVFEPFFTTDRARGGTGLGLGIVRNLVATTLGGTVTLESTPGRGARFRLRFPISVPEVPRVG